MRPRLSRARPSRPCVPRGPFVPVEREEATNSTQRRHLLRSQISAKPFINNLMASQIPCKRLFLFGSLRSSLGEFREFSRWLAARGQASELQARQGQFTPLITEGCLVATKANHQHTTLDRYAPSAGAPRANLLTYSQLTPRPRPRMHQSSSELPALRVILPILHEMELWMPDLLRMQRTPGNVQLLLHDLRRQLLQVTVGDVPW